VYHDDAGYLLQLLGYQANGIVSEVKDANKCVELTSCERSSGVRKGTRSVKSEDEKPAIAVSRGYTDVRMMLTGVLMVQEMF
jgi:hypothetical protein